MDKKIKLQEIKKAPEGEEKTRSVVRISLDDLPDVEPKGPDVALTPVKERKLLPKQETPPLVFSPPPPKEAVEKVSFDRSFPHLFTYKLFSFVILGLVLELFLHFLGYFDGMDVFNLADFRSFFFGTYKEWNWAKVLLGLMLVYFLTPDEKVMVSRKGIVCHQVEVLYYFYTTRRIFLTWEEIHRVDYVMRFFEPYLFFYDKDGKILGQMDFSLSSPKDFFYFLEQNAPANHPIFRIKNGPSEGPF